MTMPRLRRLPCHPSSPTRTSTYQPERLRRLRMAPRPALAFWTISTATCAIRLHPILAQTSLAQKQHQHRLQLQRLQPRRRPRPRRRRPRQLLLPPRPQRRPGLRLHHGLVRLRRRAQIHRLARFRIYHQVVPFRLRRAGGVSEW
jgi:hypothetical protein